MIKWNSNTYELYEIFVYRNIVIYSYMCYNMSVVVFVHVI